MGNKAIYLLLLTATLTQANQNTVFEKITVQAFPLPNQISSYWTSIQRPAQIAQKS
ncbi:MAG: hypothetical protein P8I13_00885 [Porticoccaceae bacterium]|nr:hypothetical protein [Porticoccaceae bacterium]